MCSRMIRNAAMLCAALHILAWCTVATVWTINWWRSGPAPAGPLYYDAEKFIHHIDIFVYDAAHGLSIKISQLAAIWLSADLGACLTITFAGLLLLAGSLQWFLLGRVVQWAMVHGGTTLALGLLGFYVLWIGGSTFLWVAG
jgi:hypothetical protein